MAKLWLKFKVTEDLNKRVHSQNQSQAISASKGAAYLVAADPAGLEGLGGELLQLAGDEVHAQGELIDAGLLPAEVEDADLGVRDTSAEPRLRVRLVLAVPVTSCGTATHPDARN